MDRATGTVKWFSQEKGFGFIQREDGPDVFVHFSSIQSRGFRTLEQGEPVEFEILEETKGLKAQNVVRLAPPAPAEGEPVRAGMAEAREGRSGSRRAQQHQRPRRRAVARVQRGEQAERVEADRRDRQQSARHQRIGVAPFNHVGLWIVDQDTRPVRGHEDAPPGLGGEVPREIADAVHPPKLLPQA